MEAWAFVAGLLAGGMVITLLIGFTLGFTWRRRKSKSSQALDSSNQTDSALPTASSNKPDTNSNKDSSSSSWIDEVLNNPEQFLVEDEESDGLSDSVSSDSTEAEELIIELFDMEEFADELAQSADPLNTLKRFTKRVTAQIKTDSETEHVTTDAISAYLAHQLEEAGILDTKAKFPPFDVVITHRSKTFYLRILERHISWGEKLYTYALEAALNRALFAWEHFSQPTFEGTPTLEGCYDFNQQLTQAITAQVGADKIKPASMSDIYGEWSVRQAIAAGIESFRLPLRLEANFRLNLMGGNAAFVIAHHPADSQPQSCYLEELDRVENTSAHMREQAATDYALRIALLVASHAFRCSRRLCHVYISVVLDSPKHHTCVLSGDIARTDLREFDLSQPFDPEVVCKQLGINFEIEDGRLLEITQTFSLDSERFCPSTRYENVSLSNRILPTFEAKLLGAKRVCDLAINEDAHREIVAQEIARTLGGTTLANVKKILDITQNDKDASVQEAGQRLAQQLIDGSLEENDSLALTRSFVDGGSLSEACTKALDALNEKDPNQAADILCDVLAPLDSLDVYTDTDETSWRDFSSYVGRTLYNRLYADESRETKLVPDAYYSAQLLMASAQIELGHHEAALGYSLRAHDLNPFDMSAVLRVVRCYELIGDLEAASKTLREHLKVCFDLRSIATCYYRLAFIEWHLGNIAVADACYLKAINSGFRAPQAIIEVQLLRSENHLRGTDPAEVNDVLEQDGIPLAPTSEIVDLLIEAAQGATDAEIFPVAKSFATVLTNLTRDDVMSSIAASLELDPDR